MLPTYIRSNVAAVIRSNVVSVIRFNVVSVIRFIMVAVLRSIVVAVSLQKYEKEWKAAKTAAPKSEGYDDEAPPAQTTVDAPDEAEERIAKAQAEFEAEIEADLKSIREVCERANAQLKTEYASKISSAGLVAKALYWVGAAGVDRLSRSGKFRQAATNIDDLFAEVCSSRCQTSRSTRAY